ncbi:hypothetical protein [Rhizobium leguminosarum]|uniref:hypothetical protein n=1 Tax=Rhizobium leguminosarum TaxID=384 RepID=UPI0004056F42|nr:hypothetical protein [Rhizobium leguminosarum]MBY5471496.1 hypothetical protein [Rhizobium leguminosarum]
MRREHYIRDALLTMREGRQLNLTVPVDAHYLSHSGPIRFSRPAPSTGTRKQPQKNIVAKRGTAVHIADNQAMGFQGSIEMNALLIYQVVYDVVEFREEYPRIPYRGADDRDHTHTFDHWLRLRDGTRLVSSAKPVLLIKKTGLEQTLEQIRPFVCPKYADDIRILTEYQATDEAAASAARILRCRRTRVEDHIQDVRGITASFHGSFLFGDLARIARIEADYAEAIWALIDDGYLRPTCVMDDPLSRTWIVRAGRIDDHTLLCVVR